MDEYLKKITDYLGSNELLTVKEAESIGVKRHILATYAKHGDIERVARGIYSLVDDFNDEFELLQKNNKKIIYSFGTALYFHGLSDRAPNMIHITVPQGYNVNHIKKKYHNIVFHYVKKSLFEIGIIEIKSPQGGIINVYDIERCICDITKDRNTVDIQIYQRAIKEYFESKQKNLRKLIKYSKLFGVENKIRGYIEVLT